jgi:hypothetical protein
MEGRKQIAQFARDRKAHCANAAQAEQNAERRLAWENMASLWENLVQAIGSMTDREAEIEMRRLQDIERVARLSGLH